MTSQDDKFAKKLTSYLDNGAADLKAGTAYRLQLARAKALARLADPQRSMAPRMAPALVGAGNGTRTGTRTAGGSGGFRMNTKYVAGVLLIVVLYFGYHQWQAYQQLTDLQETDAAILSSDLPIDAYLDRGFQNWLKSATDD